MTAAAEAEIARLTAALATMEEAAVRNGVALQAEAREHAAARITELETANAALTQLVGRYRTDNSALKERITELEAEAARATTVTEGMEMVTRSYLRGLETEWAGAAAKIAELEAALLPLAEAADEFPDDAPERIYLWRVEPSLWVDPDHREPKQITLKDARNARAILQARPAP